MMLAKLSSVAVLAVFLTAQPCFADQTSSRTDVPISQTVLPNGDIRYSVPVSVGGSAPIDAALDTGSFGLRVLSRALSQGWYEATDMERRYPFGGGARLNGVLAKAELSIGAVRTNGPVLFQLVQSVDCIPQKPKCPASRLDPKDYGIAGDGYAGQGFEAIIGLSLRKAMGATGADNPLGAIGDGRWIVVLPRPGESASGHLIVNPTPDETVGFTLLQLEPQPSRQSDGSVVRGWKDTSLSGCLINETSKEKVCGQSYLDSGAPGFAINSSKAGGQSSWSEGTPVKMRIEGGGSPVDLSFKVGQDMASKVHILPAKDDATRLSFGSFPYFSYAVLYDQRNGIIGLKPRDQ